MKESVKNDKKKKKVLKKYLPLDHKFLLGYFPSNFKWNLIDVLGQKPLNLIIRCTCMVMAF